MLSLIRHVLMLLFVVMENKMLIICSQKFTEFCRQLVFIFVFHMGLKLKER